MVHTMSDLSSQRRQSWGEREIHEVPGYGPVYPRPTTTVTFHGKTLAEAMQTCAAWLEGHYQDGEPINVSFFHDVEPIAMEPDGPRVHDLGWSLHLTCDK